MRNGRSQEACKIATVAGCKGGVGKSVIACAIAIEAGRSGLDVILVDADLGGPNMHTYLGIQSPELVISDFLSRRIPTIEQIILRTEYPGVSFVSSAGNSPSQANLRFAQKAKIMKSLSLITSDLLIIDIGAGSSYDVMDFFSLTDGGIIVSTPEPTSIINSYSFVKNVAYRRITREFRNNSLATEILRRGMNPAAEDGIPEMRELMG
jgi:flagellar biosynthesis protein FlhG